MQEFTGGAVSVEHHDRIFIELGKSYLLLAKLDLIPEIELSSNDLLIDLAKIGLGIAFVPDYCINHENKELFVLKTKEKMPSRQIVVSVNTTMPVSASTEEFLNLLPEVGN